MNIIEKIKSILFGNRMFVTMDAKDGSITLSEKLYKTIDKDCGGRLHDVYVFATSEQRYAFTANPGSTIFKNDKKDVQRPIATVQYNTKTKTVGFMPTNPTLAMMYYSWGFADKQVKATVTKHKTQQGLIYYQIEL